ncbi:DUF3108 domain-containing protein [Glaciimonas soli]|uniref:DUF3108 domain-containing protein n=1 Tax=Glaciimonas soli TaxID=2590999 RepID=A0A843YR97_9BURK|nr:DUF3108 domain-containing protein [Glaciimonas soli]MQR00254.1 DUF3108 domain-containing protein [Glaciimonas soli]
MTTASAPTPLSTRSPKTANKASRRWLLLLLLLLSIILHVLFISWSSRNLGIPESTQPKTTVITANLEPLPPVTKPVMAPEPIEPTPAPKPTPVTRKPKVVAKTTPIEKPVEATPPVTETVTPIDTDNTVTYAPMISSLDTTDKAEVVPDAGPAGNGTTEAAANTAAKEEKTAPVPLPPPPAAIHYETAPPPPAELKYDVRALNKGQTYYGSGKITWQTDGHSYTINGQAGALFITALDFKSEGELNYYGVSPILYTEKKFRKSATNTHFHRERNQITFSASTNSYPRTGGEQDRASIVWQLASIGRGDPSKFIAGAVIDLFVAGTTDADTWRFQIAGEEPVTVGIGTVNAWHIVRIPQPGSHEQKLDIWLAPDDQWYPVKLLFTETSGDWLEMSLSKLIPTAQPPQP